MATSAIRAFAFFIMASVCLLGVAALSASAQAQVIWDIVGTDNASIEPNLIGVVTTPDLPVSCSDSAATCNVNGTLTIPAGTLGGPGTTIDFASDVNFMVVSVSESPPAAGDNFVFEVNKDGYNCFESNPNVLFCEFGLTQAFISLTLTEQLDDMQLSVGGDVRIAGNLQVAGKIIEPCSVNACSAGVTTLTCGATETEIACAGSPTLYAIGDIGPAGGWVFHVTDGGLHGLEAAPVDQSTDVGWGCFGSDITGADGTTVGSGAQNTADILGGCVTRPICASVADTYVLNGYHHWFLPSKDELELMYQNLHLAGLGGFSDGIFSTYWSSSEANASNAWAMAFSDGNLTFLNKQNTIDFVRAVRAF